MIYGNKTYAIEVKIYNVELTGSQKNNYIQCKEINDYCYLIPKNYYLESEIDHKILYWEDLIKKVFSKFKNFNVVIDDLYNYWNSNITFDDKEINLMKLKGDFMNGLNNVLIPSTIKKLFEIIDEVKGKFYGRQYNNAGYYGFYLNNEKYNIDKSYAIWIGVWFDVWEKRGYPIVVSIDDWDNEKKEVEKKLEKHFEKYENDGENYLIGLNPDDLKDNSVAKVISKVNEVIKILK